MNSRQRNYLRALAVNMEPVVTIGKQGLSESVLSEINQVLEQKELVKITVLKNALLDTKDVLNDIVTALNAQPVARIGSKIVIYRYSEKKDVQHILIPLS